MSKRSNDIGPIGRTVARNITQLRRARGLGQRELSAKLTALGWPGNASILSNVEVGRRRVDVDDLVVMAQALEVQPGQLLVELVIKAEFVVSVTAEEML